jgi:membrane-bound lytic murein transglycosylase D
MRKSRAATLTLSFCLLVSTTGGHAAGLSGLDLSNGNTPHEFFPLIQLPLEEPPVQAPRSELQSEEAARRWADLKTQILTDSQHRVSAEFSVPYGLWERTWFWFDIYTRYGEAHHVIHHVLYPWIVYKVYDTTQTLVNSSGPLWLRRDRATKLAKREAQNIRQALVKLSRKKYYVGLTGLEKELYDSLANVPGSRPKIFAEAARNVRSQLGQRDFFLRGLVNSGKYLPHMEAEFRAQGIPTELTRLPFVESSFNENAYSKVGASGIWQIMPATGRAYMTVNDHIDERNSPLKATRVAAKILRNYVRSLGQWPLAVTAYNNGIGNIQVALRAARSKDLATMISRYHRGDFQFASSNFFTCFLAAMYAEKYHDFIFRNVSREPVQERSIVQLGTATSARKLPRITGVDREQLLAYNLDLRSAFRRNAVLPRGFKVFVPAGPRDLVDRRALGIQPKRSSRGRT